MEVAGLFCSVCFIKSFEINVTLKIRKRITLHIQFLVFLTAICARDHLNNRFLSLDNLKHINSLSGGKCHTVRTVFSKFQETVSFRLFLEASHQEEKGGLGEEEGLKSPPLGLQSESVLPIDTLVPFVLGHCFLRCLTEDEIAPPDA